jgi:hypothetical protein
MFLRLRLRALPRPGRFRAGLHVLVLLALAQPLVALPHSLDELLRLPLEQLLQIEFAPARGTQ